MTLSIGRINKNHMNFRAIFFIQLLFTLLFYVFFFLQYNILCDEPSWKVLYLPRVFIQSNLLFHFYAFALTILILTESRFFKQIIFLTLFIISVIYIAQLTTYYYSGGYLFPAVFLQFEAITLYLNGSIFLVAICFLLLWVGFIYLVFLKKKTQILNRRSLFLYTIVSVILIQATCQGSYLLTQKITKEFAIKHSDQINISPELSFFSTIGELLDTHPIKKPIFSTYDLAYLESVNLPVDTLNEYPFEKCTFYSDTIPYKKKRNIKHKNVIIFFVESLSSRFLGCYDSEFRDLTPNIDSFAKESLIINGYINHTTPTINGLRGQLFSFYPQSDNEDFRNKKPDLAQLKGLPHYLSESGYSTSILTYDEKGAIINTNQIFKDAGFNNVLNKELLKKKYKFSSVDFLTDREMLTATIGEIQEYKESNRPFFLAVSTVGTHVGNQLPIGCIKYFEHDCNTLHLVHEFDNNFGRFWKYFKQSGLYENTTVILTADHSFFPNPELNAISEKKIINYYDEIAFLIYDPEYKLDTEMTTNCTSICLAPTVLHLLGIKNSKNSFLGSSLFDKETNKRFYCGGVRDNFFYRKDNFIVQLPRDSATIIQKWLDYELWLVENNKIFHAEKKI